MSAPVVPAATRPPLVRPREGRVVGGVAAGVATHLGLPLRAVRVGLVLLVPAGGAGIALYLWLWALVPVEGGASSSVLPAGRGAGRVGPRSARPSGRRGPPGDVLLGLGLLAAGLYGLALWLGLPVQPQVVVPLAVVGVGTVIVFSQLDEVERGRWAARTGVTTRGAVARVVGGALLVVAGVLVVVVQGTVDESPLARSIIAAAAVLAGATLVLAPWGLRLWRDLEAERTARIVVAARADVAAHLHDSVLQTLALIQRRSDQPGEVARLARAQERDLRSWLYGAPPSDAETLVAAVTEVAADAEDLHGAVVEVVTVGDVPLDGRSGALVAALREAVANAARHAGGRIAVYVEAGPDGVEAFVRDRGPGFDPDAVPADRSGLRESVIGRMARHGGSARVTSTPGEGTEVRLELPATAKGERP